MSAPRLLLPFVVLLVLRCAAGEPSATKEQKILLYIMLNYPFFLYGCPTAENLSSGAHVRTFPGGGPYWFTFAGAPGNDYTLTLQEATGQDTRMYERYCNAGEVNRTANLGIGQIESPVAGFSYRAGAARAFRLECVSACGSSFNLTIP